MATVHSLNAEGRQFVPFDSLWQMAIDVPYSFLVRDGVLAWSCGQLALDAKSQVMAPGDLPGQSRVVADYIKEILGRGGLAPEAVAKLLLYYVPDDGPGDESARDGMMAIFRDAFGPNCLLVPIPVPYYYYDGVMLEVDLFCDSGRSLLQSRPSGTESDGGLGLVLEAVAGQSHLWLTARGRLADWQGGGLRSLSSFVLDQGVDWSTALSQHWFAPTADLAAFSDLLTHGEPESSGPILDLGAVVASGARSDEVVAHLLFARPGEAPVFHEMGREEGVYLVTRQCGVMTWIQARALEDTLGLVPQTEIVMAAIARKLAELGLDFSHVVKSTTHYVGGSTAAELHDNMAVRNAYYQKPGPASTGLPVFGFADPASRVVVDLTLVCRGETDPGT